jgi:hypothetical protein
MSTRPRQLWRLRTGRRVGRTIYVQLGDTPSDNDQLVGVMDTPELAALVVTSTNNQQAAIRRALDAEEGTP